MDEIKAIKDKYEMPSEEALIHVFRTQFHRLEETLRKREQHLLESDMKLQEFESKFDVTEESVCADKRLLNVKLQELTACNQHLNDLQTEKSAVSEEVHQLEIQRNTMRNSKPNLKDQQIIDHGLKKFTYYKQLTGIRWDFGALKGTTKGFVTNGTDYVHSFNYKTDEHGSELEGLLWREIEKSTEKLEVTETKEKECPTIENVLLIHP